MKCKFMGNIQVFRKITYFGLAVKMLRSYFFGVIFQGDVAKTSRVRTNYKLRVGEQEQGRYAPYSQVRAPPNGKYPNDEAEKYYRHPKGAKITKVH